MAKSVQVPKFGNWEGEADIPYTACFDKAFKGHPRGEPIRPSSHQINAEKLCHDASTSGQADPHSEKDNPTEKQEDLEVPKFGDWDGQGGDVPYTIYFERVRKRGSRGKTTSKNVGHHNECTVDARRLARRELVEENSHEHHKGQKSGAIVRADSKQGSKNRLQESSAVSVKENKKLLTRRSPDSKQCQTDAGAVKKGHPVSDRISLGQSKFDISGESRLRTKTSRNEEVVPITAFPKFGRWDETDPSSSNGLSQISKVLKHGKEAAQSASVNDSFYRNSQTKIKEQRAKTCCFPWGRK